MTAWHAAMAAGTGFLAALVLFGLFALLWFLLRRSP